MSADEIVEFSKSLQSYDIIVDIAGCFGISDFAGDKVEDQLGQLETVVSLSCLDVKGSHRHVLTGPRPTDFCPVRTWR